MNLQDVLNKVFPKPKTISVADIPKTPTKEDLESLSRLGLTLNGVQNLIQQQTQVQQDRYSLYNEIYNSLSHPLISAAVELYSSTATSFDRGNNATVYITSSSKQYKAVLDKLLDTIDIEEHIYDWCWNIVAFGELFARVHGQPKLGIISLDDSKPSIEFYRIENNGQLVGFVNTSITGNNATSQQLLPPWALVHFRLNSSRKRRSLIGDNMGNFRGSILGAGGNSLQESTSYGSSLIQPALPTYKRLRLAEDCILMSRATRGITKFIFKIGMDSGNFESVSSLLTTYSDTIKRARALNTTGGSENFGDVMSVLASSQDIILPVWGDVNNLQIDKIGEDADIKWLTDVEELRNQLATALATPLSLLGGFQAEGSPALGDGPLERTDIRFARSVSKVQRTLLQGIKRLCQIHLAYLGMDPDPKLFDVHMGDSSGAEEAEQKENMIKSTEAADKLVDVLVKFIGEDKLDREKLFNVVNDKILMVKDLHYSDLVKDSTPTPPSPIPEPQTPQSEEGAPVEPEARGEVTIQDSKLRTGDLQSYSILNESEWKTKFGDVEVVIEKRK